MKPVAHLGPFEVLEPVAGGAFGRVWRGRNTYTGAPVAIKVVDIAVDRHERDLFGPELEALTRLQHPRIVAPLDHGVVPWSEVDALQVAVGAPWLAMTWVGGGDLNRVRAELPTVRRWAGELLDALAHAHARGVLHLDVKPKNVLVRSSGTLTLTDFGIAALVENQTERRGGSPGYMAPEQIRGGRLTPASDLYALGCTVWALLFGRPPFGELDARGRMEAHQSLVIQPPPGLPVEVASWLVGCLAREPEERFQGASEARDALWSDELRGIGDVHGGAASTTATLTPDEWSSQTFTFEGPPVTMRPLLPDRPQRGELPDHPPQDGIQAMLALRARRLCLEGSERALRDTAALPMLGREEVRSDLWELARTVRREGRPRAVALVGDDGSGRSRLARWVSETLGELGARRTRELPERAVRRLTVVVSPAQPDLAARLARVDGPVLLLVLGACPGIPEIVLGPMAPWPLSLLARGLTGVDEGAAGTIVAAAAGSPGRLLAILRRGPPWPAPSDADADELQALGRLVERDPEAALERIEAMLLGPMSDASLLSVAPLGARAVHALGLDLDDPRAMLVAIREAYCWQEDAQNHRLDALEARLAAVPSDRYRAWLWFLRGLRRRFSSGVELPREEALQGLEAAARCGEVRAEAFLLVLLLAGGAAEDDGVFERAVAAWHAITGDDAWKPLLATGEMKRLLRAGDTRRARALGEELLQMEETPGTHHALATLAWREGDLPRARSHAAAGYRLNLQAGLLRGLSDELLMANLAAEADELTMEQAQAVADRIQTCFGRPTAFGTEALTLVLEQAVQRDEHVLADIVRRSIARYEGRPSEATQRTRARMGLLPEGAWAGTGV